MTKLGLQFTASNSDNPNWLPDTRKVLVFIDDNDRALPSNYIQIEGSDGEAGNYTRKETANVIIQSNGKVWSGTMKQLGEKLFS